MNRAAEHSAECHICRQPIKGGKVDGKWIALDPDGRPHACPAAVTSEIDRKAAIRYAREYGYTDDQIDAAWAVASREAKERFRNDARAAAKLRERHRESA